MDATLYVGVDAGGSKTEYLVADADGNEVARHRGDGANAATLGPERSAGILAAGVAEALRGLPPPAAAFFGVAGAGVADGASRVEALLRAALPGVLLAVDTDIRCVIEAAGAEGPCVAAIVGTGVSVFADDGASLRRFGGWGALFDGAGSGYDIGRDAIRHLLAVEDGLVPATPLSAAVSARLGRPAFARMGELQKAGRAEIASFAPLVFDAADAGDAAAKEILSLNIMHVAELVRAARRLCPAAAAGPLVMGGGLCARADVIGPALREALGADAQREIVFPAKAPVFGAVRRAVRLHSVLRRLPAPAR